MHSAVTHDEYRNDPKRKNDKQGGHHQHESRPSAERRRHGLRLGKNTGNPAELCPQRFFHSLPLSSDPPDLDH
jgi:hypothetical protein